MPVQEAAVAGVLVPERVDDNDAVRLRRLLDDFEVALGPERGAQLGVVEGELVGVVQGAPVLGVDDREPFAAREPAREPHRAEGLPRACRASDPDQKRQPSRFAGLKV